MTTQEEKEIVEYNKCVKCGSELERMRDPEGKEWDFCLKCYNEEE